MQLSPNESFVINRILKDHSDTDTHFVQAVVYDSVTRAVISTLNLTDNGNRWFSKAYKAPSGDPYSIGRHIIVISTVYDDVGYTIKSPNYAEESQEYLIQQRWNPTLGGATGQSIDYREIAKIVAEVLDKKKLPELVAKSEVPQVFPTEEILKGVKDIVSEIPEPIEPEKIDLSPLEKGLEKIVKAIKDIPPQKEFDPIIKETRKGTSEIIESVKELTYLLQKIEKRQTDEIVKGIAKEINEGNIRFSLFGDNNPFDGTKQKRDNYLSMLAKKYQ